MKLGEVSHIRSSEAGSERETSLPGSHLNTSAVVVLS